MTKFMKDVQTLIEWLLLNGYDFTMNTTEEDMEMKFKIEGIVRVTIKHREYDVVYTPYSWNFKFGEIEDIYECMIQALNDNERMNNKI